MQADEGGFISFFIIVVSITYPLLIITLVLRILLGHLCMLFPLYFILPLWGRYYYLYFTKGDIGTQGGVKLFSNKEVQNQPLDSNLTSKLWWSIYLNPKERAVESRKQGSSLKIPYVIENSTVLVASWHTYLPGDEKQPLIAAWSRMWLQRALDDTSLLRAALQPWEQKCLEEAAVADVCVKKGTQR